jgi:hypothetical protein
MITEKSYLEAKKLIDTYESEQLNKHNVIQRSKQSFCVVCGKQYKNPNNDSDTCYDCRLPIQF